MDVCSQVPRPFHSACSRANFRLEGPPACLRTSPSKVGTESRSTIAGKSNSSSDCTNGCVSGRPLENYRFTRGNLLFQLGASWSGPAGVRHLLRQQGQQQAIQELGPVENRFPKDQRTRLGAFRPYLCRQSGSPPQPDQGLASNTASLLERCHCLANIVGEICERELGECAATVPMAAVVKTQNRPAPFGQTASPFDEHPVGKIELVGEGRAEHDSATKQAFRVGRMQCRENRFRRVAEVESLFHLAEF